MSDIPKCPLCNCEYAYEDNAMYVCPECAHEWAIDSTSQGTGLEKIYKDANGNILNNGDTVSLIKDLKIKGTASKVKAGTKVKNIRLVDGDHDIDCKVDGVGAMMLKSEFVKKV